MTVGQTSSHAAAGRPASYGHGTILAGAADEARKSTQGRRMIRARVMALGQDSIYWKTAWSWPWNPMWATGTCRI
jgi:hypothetical protein